MTVGLAMLVKDEEEALPATLEQILPVIDAWTVLDTGSTDSSKEIIRDALGHLPGGITRAPFNGFGPARTALLRHAKGRADYTLMIDADHTLHAHGDKPDLTADAYLVRVEDAWGGSLPLLTRSQHPFEYRGVAHSYLATDQPATIEPTGWLTVDGGPGASPEKLKRDLELLTAEFAAHPDDPRTVFYLAQTYRDLDRPHEAIRLYLLRAEMAGFEEERWHARYQAGVLLGAHVEGLQGAEQLVKAWRERPSRAEALRALARLADAVADKLDRPTDNLFVELSAYRDAA